MSDMDAYKDIFLSESAEYVQSIIDGLLALEANPKDLEPVETVFRGAHSLKGMSATMGYERTADLTHKMESLMDTVRRHEQVPDSSLIDVMLRAVDTVKALIEDESSGGDSVDPSEIVAEVVARTGGEAAEAVTEKAGGEEQATGEGGEAAKDEGEAEESQEKTLHVTVSLEESCVLKAVRAYMAIKRLSHMGTVIETNPSAREIEDEQFDRSFEVFVKTAATLEEVDRALTAITEVEAVEAVELQADLEAESGEAEREADQQRDEEPPSPTLSTRQARPIPKLAETQTVRISIGHLDQMVNLVGELVIIHSRLQQLAREMDSLEILETLEEMHRVSGDLQHEVMQTRMVPVGNIFNRFPRMVRDLAHELGKDITFEMEGLDIELDRTVLDEIGDPIVHLLRNSIDHGIETPKRRQKAGKPEKGVIRLIAARERDQVTISVIDDGAGLDVEKVWAKACERGLAQPDQRSAFSEDDVIDFICRPGFSTAETATKVSGRGVGMDVVRGKIEYLGGSLTVKSKKGQGSQFTLTLPLTLAIIQAVLVEAEQQVFALPLGPVVEVLSPRELPVKSVDGKPVVVLRDGGVAPLQRLDSVLGKGDGAEPGEDDLIVLLEIGETMKALAVDQLIGRQEIVIKPLSRMFKQLKGLGGATVLGDGRVALILDPRTLFAGDDVA